MLDEVVVDIGIEESEVMHFMELPLGDLLRGVVWIDVVCHCKDGGLETGVVGATAHTGWHALGSWLLLRLTRHLLLWAAEESWTGRHCNAHGLAGGIAVGIHCAGIGRMWIDRRSVRGATRWR